MKKITIDLWAPVNVHGFKNPKSYPSFLCYCSDECRNSNYNISAKEIDFSRYPRKPLFAIAFFYHLKILAADLYFSRQMGFHYISITGTKYLQPYLITPQGSLKFLKNLILHPFGNISTSHVSTVLQPWFNRGCKYRRPILSRDYGCVTNINGVWIDWWHLLTPSLQSFTITMNYSAFANLPTSQIIRTH